MKLFSFDCESRLIAPGRKNPKMACLTWAESGGKAGIDNPDKGLDRLEGALKDSGTFVVGANVAFDLGLAAQAAPGRFLPLIHQALDANRVGCTQVLSKLQNIAGTKPASSHSLGALAALWLDRRVGGKNNDGDAWRTHYRKLMDIPVAKWPEEASEYAISDAVVARDIFERQATIPTPDLFPQVRAAWALHVMGSRGFAVEPEAVYALDQRIRPPVEALVEELKGIGLYRPDGTQDRKMLLEMITEAYNGHPPRGQVTEKMEKKGITEGNIQYGEDVLRESKHPILVKLADISANQKEMSSFLPMLMDAANRGLPVCPSWNVLVASGRTSCREPNAQQFPKRKGVRECIIPRPGMVFFGADYGVAELRSLAQVLYNIFGQSDMRDAINAGRELHLMTASRIMQIRYEDAVSRYEAGDVEVANARALSKACFHPDTEVLTRKGWQRIEDLDPKTEVLAAQPDDATGEVQLQWEVPLQLTERESPVGELVHLYNEGMDLRVTPDHRMLVFGAGNKHKVVTPEEVGKSRYWQNAGHLDEGAWQPDPGLLRLAVATQADGSVTKSGRVRFGFTKQRKIARLEEMLSGRQYTGSESGGVTFFTLERELGEEVLGLLENKSFPWSWLDLTPKCREEVLDEAAYWDASRAERWTQYQYFNTDMQSVDVLQALATMAGRKTRKVVTPGRCASRKPHCVLSVKQRSRTRGGNLRTTRIPYTGKVVCLSVPSTFIVARDGGVPVIVGQCNFGYPGGMGHPTFVETARGYGHVISDERSKELKHLWLSTFPEMSRYFAYMSRRARTGRFTLRQHFSGRVRAGCTFPSGCNTLFQGLVADGFKRALYAIVREQLVDRSSDMYGTATNAAIHDEFLCEGTLEQAPRAARRLTQIMVEQMSVVAPDVEHEAEPYMMRRWRKKAKAYWDDAGELRLPTLGELQAAGVAL